MKYLPKSDTISVLRALESFMSYFGIFCEVVSDNGPPFNSSAFEKHLSTLGIKVTKTPVYHPQSNGLAERGVQTVKTGLKKIFLDTQTNGSNVVEIINRFLFAYRNTPSMATKVTPSDLIFSYKPKTLISLLNFKKSRFTAKQLDKNGKTVGKCGKNVKCEVREMISRDKFNFCKHINHRNVFVEYVEGQKAMYRNHFKDHIKWIPVRVLKKVSR